MQHERIVKVMYEQLASIKSVIYVIFTSWNNVGHYTHPFSLNLNFKILQSVDHAHVAGDR